MLDPPACGANHCISLHDCVVLQHNTIVAHLRDVLSPDRYLLRDYIEEVRSLINTSAIVLPEQLGIGL